MKGRFLRFLARNERGREFLGSAAEFENMPLTRSYFELLERARIYDPDLYSSESFSLLNADGTRMGEITRRNVFPRTSAEDNQWVFCHGNGVAIQREFRTAAENAALELQEKDRVERSWYGQVDPVPCELNSSKLRRGLRALPENYEFKVYRFPPPESDGTQNVFVVGVFGFPEGTDTPFPYGFSPGRSFESAARGAEEEALQRFLFLWNINLQKEMPTFSPTARYHEKLFQTVPGVRTMRNWLEEGHPNQLGAYPKLSTNNICFVDITPLELEGKARIIKAISETALPLITGRGHPEIDEMPSYMLTHPP